MKNIILKPKIKINHHLDLRNISLIDASLNFNSIFKLKILYGNIEKKIGDLFDIKVEINKKENVKVEISGINNNCDYVGWKWKNGNLKINSNVGSFLGAKMSGGNIIVNGSAENFVGSEMTGGSININKDACDFVGSPLPGSKSGMKGGDIIIKGKARDYLALNMRRGLIFVNSGVRNYCCNNMIAGTVIIKKDIGKNFGVGMKRGTILTNDNSFSKTFFKENGFSSSIFYELLNNYIIKKYGIKMFKERKSTMRYLGDKNIDGMGEIFLKLEN